MKTGREPSDHLISCSYCKALLPAYANFCSSCGKQVKQKQNGELEADTEHSDEVGEQEAETIRLESLPQIYLRRWLLYQSLKNKNHSDRSQGSNSSLQDVEEVSTQSISSSRELAVVDTTQLSEVSNQIKPTLSSPAILAPSIPKIWKRISILSNLLWPVIIILSAIAAGLVSFVFTEIAIRAIIVFWFLFICPGMILVRFLRLKEPVVEWTLAIALSFAIDAIVAGIQLYAGKWSPAGTLTLLIGLSLGGAIVQLVMMVPATGIKMYSILGAIRGLTEKNVPLPHVISHEITGSPTSPLREPAQVRRFKKPGMLFLTLFALFVTLLGSLGVGAGLWFYITSQHSPTSVAPSSGSQVGQPSLHPTVSSQPTVTATPVPVTSPFPNLAKLYTGTLGDIPTGETVKISLTSIQQQRDSISGYLSETLENNLFSQLPKSGPFHGTVNTSKEIQFTLMDDTGQATFSFNGSILTDSSIQGSFCSLGAAAGRCSDYGLWSVSPST